MHDDQVRALHARMDNLERLVRDKNAGPTMPIYDSTNFPQDAVYGQIVTDQNQDAWVYGQDDAWHNISGLSAIKHAYVKAPISTIGGAAGQYRIDFPLSGFYTNSPNDFDFGLDTYSGGLYHTIGVKSPGDFIAWLQCSFFSGTVGDKLTTYWDNAVAPAALQAGNPDWVYSATLQNQASVIEWGYLYSGFGPNPSRAAMHIRTYNTNTINIRPSLAIIKLDDIFPITAAL